MCTKKKNTIEFGRPMIGVLMDGKKKSWKKEEMRKDRLGWKKKREDRSGDDDSTSRDP